jgi:DNA-binding CsgD family transcriptional regulator
VNTVIDKKEVRVLCIGGRMQSEKSCFASGGLGYQLLLKYHQPDDRGKGLLEAEIDQADALLLFLAGSGWDWLERLHLPQGAIAERPAVAILDNYNEKFALSLLKLGVEEVTSGSDCTPEKLQFSVLAAITRFRRNLHKSAGAEKSGMSAQEQTALKALDTLPFGIMFVDKESRVMFMNAAAKSVCSNGSGLYISKDKRCCAADHDENSVLHRLVNKMSQEPEGMEEDENHTIKITGEDGDALTMLMVSVGKQSAEHGVAIFIDSGGGFFNISEESLKSVYALTQSESELLLRMVQGETLAEISEARSVTMHTVRAQLKSVFAKTDTNRQASLIKKVLTGPAVLMQR